MASRPSYRGPLILLVGFLLHSEICLQQVMAGFLSNFLKKGKPVTSCCPPTDQSRDGSLQLNLKPSTIGAHLVDEEDATKYKEILRQETEAKLMEALKDFAVHTPVAKNPAGAFFAEIVEV